MRECALVHRPEAFARTVAACLAAAALFAGVTRAQAGPVAVYISPDGSDDNPGTAERPIRTLKKLEDRIKQPGVQEVVFHAGVYRGHLEIRNSGVGDPKNPPPLTLRAEEGATVVIDGALPLTRGEPVPDWPGIYVIRDMRPAKSGHLPAMWDEPARRRYQLAGGMRALRKFPGTYWLTPQGLYIHPVDGKPLEAQHLEIWRSDYPHGIYVMRANVTVKNITVRNFWRDGQKSSGICVAATGKWFTVHNVTVENCRVQNCPRGITIRASDSRVTGCRVDDCGTGVYVKAPRVIVEKCRLFKVRDEFMVPMYPQEDTGIEVYYDAGQREDVRFNLCKGFACGIFVKCLSGDFVIENNTIVQCETGLGFTSSDPGRKYYARRNLVYGSRRALWEPGEGKAKFTAESNLIWPGPEGVTTSSRKDLARLKQLGKDNVLADPRLANANANDFRLLPGSPCLPKAAGEPGIGAFGLAGGATIAKGQAGDLPTASIKPLSSVRELPGQAGENDPFMFLRWNVLLLEIGASTHNGVFAQMKYRLDDGAWSKPQPFRRELELKPATREEPYRIGVAVSDDRGRWSKTAVIRLLVSSEKPRIVGTPVVRANAYGAAITFKTNVPCNASGTFGPEGRDMAAGDRAGVRMQHSLGFVLEKPAEGSKVTHAVQLEDADGAKHPSATGSVVLRGANHIWTVEPDKGADVEDGGTEQRPWRTVQYAVDRALPGDRILLKPGIYSRPVVITRGGAPGAPLTIAAEQKFQAVFDMRFRVERVIHLIRAPYVELDGLEMRFYGTPDRPRGPALFIVESPGVAVRNCKIWNAYWQGPWPEGIAAEVVQSPRFVAERNLIFRNADGLRLWSSPDSRLVYNTCIGQTYAGMKLVESAAGTVLRNNDLAFNGNDILSIKVNKIEEMETFDSDYNNLGARLRYWRDEPGVVPNIKPREPMVDGSKAVVIFYRSGGTWVGGSNTDSTWVSDKTTPADKRGSRYFRLRMFEDWKTFSGKDKHSIFADPLHHSLVDFIFDLDPESPNIGAGENGTTIGAMDIRKGDPGK